MERAIRTSLGKRVFGDNPVATLALLKAAWPRAVGDDLARRTEVVALERGTLRIRVPDPRWRKELHRMQRDILSRLYRIAGDLTPRRLGFLDAASNTALDPVPEKHTVPAESLPSAAPAVVLEAAQAIPDPAVRARFVEVAAQYLERDRRRLRERS